VQADSEHEALEDGCESGYLGYLDGEDVRAEIVGGPFKSKDKALIDKASYVEGRLNRDEWNIRKQCNCHLLIQRNI
jgi:hypothetical protein